MLDTSLNRNYGLAVTCNVREDMGFKGRRVGAVRKRTVQLTTPLSKVNTGTATSTVFDV